jgi:DNA-binding transcriptional LysR family regulator
MEEIADIGAIQAFVAIADTGSFIAGAKAYKLSRSAMGKSLARLESHLGARLINRTTRSFSLTADGQLFYEKCVQILSDLREAEASVRQDKPRPKGTLRLTVADAFGRLVILPVLHEYAMNWPEVKFDVNFSDRRVDLVDDGFDLGIRLGGVPTDSQLIARTLGTSHTLLCAAPSYLKAHNEPHTPRDLSGSLRLLYGSCGQTAPWFLRSTTGQTVEMNEPSRFRFDSGEAIRDACVGGLGIAYLPAFLIDEDINAGRLVRILPEYETQPIPIYAVYPSRRHLSAKVRVFIDLLVTRLGTSASLGSVPCREIKWTAEHNEV